jgi:presenilin-like A22 family membrane protease
MKHRISITLLLLSMFLVTQFIGLFVVNAYTPQETINQETGEIMLNQQNQLPFGIETPETNFLAIIFYFILAIAIIAILMKYKWKLVIKIWFLLVITLALGISIYAILMKFTSLDNIAIIALAIAIPLALIKIFRANVFVHNITELFIYPGIAAVFVAILHPLSVMVLLVLISIYDMWAVWRAKFMQKMAKFEMEELHIFGGFLIPTVSKKVKAQIQRIKDKYKGKKMPEKIKKKKFKVRLAILGGGDVIFPIITAGVFMRAYTQQALFGIAGLIPALFVIGGALAGLTYLMFITKKDKAYPAMPYISVGIFAALILWYFII